MAQLITNTKTVASGSAGNKRSRSAAETSGSGASSDYAISDAALPHALREAFELIVTNAFTYNEDGSFVCTQATQLKARGGALLASSLPLQ
jgi:hypothetical protein